MSIRLQASEIDLLEHLIELRDSANLAGRYDDVFQVVEFNGGTAMLVPPGRTEVVEKSAVAIARLREAGIFQIIKAGSRGFTFDLADDVRDRLEELKTAAGRPTRMGELEAARVHAEARAERAEAAMGSEADERRSRREAVATRWGSRARTLVRVLAAVVYVVVIGLPVLLGLPIALNAVLIVVGAGIQIADWAFGRDGSGVATAVGRGVQARVLGWLEELEAPTSA